MVLPATYVRIAAAAIYNVRGVLVMLWTGAKAAKHIDQRRQTGKLLGPITGQRQAKV